MCPGMTWLKIFRCVYCIIDTKGAKIVESFIFRL